MKTMTPAQLCACRRHYFSRPATAARRRLLAILFSSLTLAFLLGSYDMSHGLWLPVLFWIVVSAIDGLGISMWLSRRPVSRARRMR
jgi:hypothetical protein